MPTWKALGILSLWLNYILGNNIDIIACILGCSFSMSTATTVLFILTLHYLHIYENVTQPLSINLPFVSKTQDITGRYIYSHNLFKKYLYSKSLHQPWLWNAIGSWVSRGDCVMLFEYLWMRCERVNGVGSFSVIKTLCFTHKEIVCLQKTWNATWLVCNAFILLLWSIFAINTRDCTFICLLRVLYCSEVGLG